MPYLELCGRMISNAREKTMPYAGKQDPDQPIHSSSLFSGYCKINW